MSDKRQKSQLWLAFSEENRRKPAFSGQRVRNACGEAHDRKPG